MDNSSFIYDSYTLQNNRTRVDFTYTTNKANESFSFTESCVFEKPLPECFETHRLLRMLHIASGISYYKLFFNVDIEHPYAMSTKESNFWNSVFLNGLGEFMYVNNLSADKIATFGPQEGRADQTTERITLTHRAVLGIGGGKDSIVAGELIKLIGVPLEGFILATGSATAQAALVGKTMHAPTHIVQRTIDPLLIQLQSRTDTYKGHIPVSLLFAITGALVALCQSSSYVIVANESSASIPRVQNNGSTVNHQWSKSFEAETLIQSYFKEYVHADLTYFSAIRPMSSVAVAKIFSKYNQYFNVFTSDNFGFRIEASKRPSQRWSIESPKTLSSYILLAAWLQQNQLLEIFGEDFLNKPSLQALFLSLLGKTGQQPLDCVGTPEELTASLNRAYELGGDITNSYLMKLAKEQGIIGNNSDSIKPLLTLSTEQAFPQTISNVLQVKIAEELS
jgi:hypothetical protein